MKQEQTRIKLRTKIQDKRENTGKQELLNRTGTNKIKQNKTGIYQKEKNGTNKTKGGSNRIKYEQTGLSKNKHDIIATTRIKKENRITQEQTG